jgi:hypothetical protein
MSNEKISSFVHGVFLFIFADIFSALGWVVFICSAYSLDAS